MSDDGAVTPKRGRKANAAAEKTEKADSGKKRARKDTKEASNDVSPAKRGRGRPKGTTKKKAGPKPKAKGTSASPGRRGRPKKDAPKESEEEDGEDEAGDEEDDE